MYSVVCVLDLVVTGIFPPKDRDGEVISSRLRLGLVSSGGVGTPTGRCLIHLLQDFSPNSFDGPKPLQPTGGVGVFRRAQGLLYVRGQIAVEGHLTH